MSVRMPLLSSVKITLDSEGNFTRMVLRTGHIGQSLCFVYPANKKHP